MFVNLADSDHNKTPIENLKKAVDLLKGKIHPSSRPESQKTSSVCSNEYYYDLFVYYSGHGGESVKKYGSWTPARDSHITRKELERIMMRLRDCENCSKEESCV